SVEGDSRLRLEICRGHLRSDERPDLARRRRVAFAVRADGFMAVRVVLAGEVIELVAPHDGVRAAAGARLAPKHTAVAFAVAIVLHELPVGFRVPRILRDDGIPAHQFLEVDLAPDVQLVDLDPLRVPVLLADSRRRAANLV